MEEGAKGKDGGRKEFFGVQIVFLEPGLLALGVHGYWLAVHSSTSFIVCPVSHTNSFNLFFFLH